MDLLSLKMHIPKQVVRVSLRGAEGRSSHELRGPSFERVLAAAGPLLAHLQAQAGGGGGPLEALLVDPERETLVASFPTQTEALLLLQGVGYRALAPLVREPARTALREARPRQPDLPEGASEAARWEHKYAVGSDGWELGRAAPPLHRLFAESPLPRSGAEPGAPPRVLVPGCGRGHEARLLAEAGAEVVAIDIAPTAVASTRRLAAERGLRITAMEADVLALPQEHEGRYDLFLEHCCFCAIDPTRRDDYVEAAARALRPGGRLIGLFYCHDYPGGPPFGSSADEIRARFGRRFTLLTEEVPTDSVLSRAGQELLAVMVKAPGA